jgi:hypothetical protein
MGRYSIHSLAIRIHEDMGTSHDDVLHLGLYCLMTSRGTLSSSTPSRTAVHDDGASMTWVSDTAILVLSFWRCFPHPSTLSPLCKRMELLYCDDRDEGPEPFVASG